MSKLQSAIEYFYANPKCSKNAAAKKFDVAPPNLYVALRKHNEDVAIFNSIGPETLASVDAWFVANPGSTEKAAVACFKIPANTLRAAYRGQAVVVRRLRLASANPVLTDPAEEMREKCAKIAEMVGGEHGAAIAASIRALP